LTRNSKIVILSDQVESYDFPLDPLTKKIFITMARRTANDNRADVDTFRQTLSNELGAHVDIPFDLMSALPKIVHSGDGEVSATLAAGSFFDEKGRVQSWRLIDIESGDRSEFNVGLAVDIGTTTVVAYLVDMITGKTIGKASDYNNQIQLGEDILSRIMASKEASGLETLQQLIVQTLNSLIKELCDLSSINPKDISAVSIGANTTMIHLLLGLDPASICRAPYIPVVNNPEIFQAKEIGLEVNPLASIYCLPSVGSYIGGDIIAGILVSGMHKHDELSLFVDIGTNGEIVIGNKDWLVACAGAAGPALEGGVTECGMRAEAGAVDSVVIKPDYTVEYTTINDSPARGICGSGLIDSLAELFIKGIIDRGARFFDGRDRFVIVPDEESSDGKEIFISQRDINNLMRTKGAVNAALEVLIEGVGCKWEDIGKFYAAGAFGQYLHIESAVMVGLYPDLPRERMIRLGNSSGEGARQVLLSNAKRREGEEIASKITYFEMNANAAFMDKYAGSKFLPHTNMDLFPSVKQRLAKYKKV